MAGLEVRDPRLHDLVAPDAPVDRLAGGLGFTEGPVWRRGELLFSDIPNQRIARWRRLPEGPELTTFARGMSNGLTVDGQGRVLAAEHNGRRVSRVADDGTRTVLAERFQGKRLNSPNDIVLKSDGSIYFTDPPYAVQPSTPGVPRPDGTLTGSRVLLDMASNDPGVPDGLKVDVQGNIFCTGPGGVWVCRPDGA